MMDFNGELSYIFIIFVTFLGLGSRAQDTTVDQPVKGFDTIQNITLPFVYMADASITVGEFDVGSVFITIIRSEALSYGSDVGLNLAYVDRPHAYLWEDAVYIPAHETNGTTRLVFYDAPYVFFTRDSMYNVSITSCDNCDIDSPRSTTITVKPEGNVTLSFETAYDSGEECDCDGCCYNYIRIRSSKDLADNMIIPLLTDSKDTAQYNEDYSLDKWFVDPQPKVNLSIDTTYHYLDVYIRKDGRFEGTEYFHLKFDEKALPDRVYVGSTKEMRFQIYDSEYGSCSASSMVRF